MSIYGGTGVSLDEVKAIMPKPDTGAPPAPIDANTGLAGDDASNLFSPKGHTHPSKVRKARVTTAADGTYTWTFSPPFLSGIIPICSALAEPVFGVTDVINAQIDGTPTNTEMKIRISRTQKSAVALIGLTILSVPASAGATVVHLLAFEP